MQEPTASIARGLRRHISVINITNFGLSSRLVWCLFDHGIWFKWFSRAE